MKTGTSTSPAVKGICYSPTWSGYSQDHKQFSDSDFANDAFPALWSAGEDTNGNKYRDDLGTMQSGGVNLVRLYNWGPTRGWTAPKGPGTAHLHFLDRAAKLGIKVIVPVSNYFLSDDKYAWKGMDPDAAFTFSSAPAGIQSDLLNFIGSVTTSAGTIHSAVHSFSVGNEIDINTFVGQGSSGAVGPDSRLARVIWWIVNLQAKISAGNLGTVLFTSPISNADQGNPVATPPLSYWFQALVNGVSSTNANGMTCSTNLPFNTATACACQTTFTRDVAGLSSITGYADWYYNSVNIYQYGADLAATLSQYQTWAANTANNLNWPGQQFSVPLLLTEIGYARASNDPADQQTQYEQVTVGIIDAINTQYSTNPDLLMGYCLYEFNDEPSAGSTFGIFMLLSGGNPTVIYTEQTGQTVVSYETFPSVSYPVDQLFPVTNTSGQELIANL